MPTSGASAARSICSGLATAATGIPEDTKQPPPVIKSLLFMVLEKPVLIVLLLTQRVDERKVAALMGTSRSRVRMATPEEVLTHTGSLIGSVPPVGHINRLRTLLDQQVLFHCEVRGVAADQQVTMSTAAVLSASQAWVADVAKHAASGASAALELPAAHSLHAPTALQRTLSPAGTRSNGNGHASSTPYARGTLPQPWVDGSQAVHLITRVAHKRRLSRLLVFVSLVPADTLPTPQESAAYVRRVWGHPSTGEPCEVQLIMGKTLERELGAPAAVELFKQVKAGQIVSVVATPQARPEDADQPSRPEKAAFSDFLTELFASADIIKVGFGLSTDLRRLCESYPELPCFGGPLAEFLDEASNGSGQAEIGSHALARTVPFRSHVDVLTLARAVWPSDRRKQVERLSLSGLSQLVLGSALDKSQQCSDWDQRPLTPAQVQYAAADAHSLTAIFDALIARQPQLLASPVWRTHLANYVVDVGSIASGVQRRLRTVGAEGGPEAGGGSRDERNVHGAVKSSPVWRAKRLPMGPPTFEQQANIPYARGGGVVGWQNAVMLFVNVNVDDPSNRSRASSYPNAFLDNGRRMTWFPSAAHSVHHPVIRYIPQVLLFCRVCARKRGPFVFCGRLFDPVVDWQGAAGRGELNCALQDYEALQDTAGFQAILQAAGGTAGPSTA
ncbi:hypothetical protein WJX72_012028 [[Myrmecia] bisecta]|uniref:3'-5' exonuclease domain-containing protein n=1 Tax=[Myrmecia] bisecta TaxID=41462 RepID=A0AAW1R913_9CHLO